MGLLATCVRFQIIGRAVIAIGATAFGGKACCGVIRYSGLAGALGFADQVHLIELAALQDPERAEIPRLVCGLLLASLGPERDLVKSVVPDVHP